MEVWWNVRELPEISQDCGLAPEGVSTSSVLVLLAMRGQQTFARNRGDLLYNLLCWKVKMGIPAEYPIPARYPFRRKKV